MNVLVFIVVVGILYAVVRITIGNKWHYGKSALIDGGVIGWISTAGMLLGAFVATLSSKILTGAPQLTEITVAGIALFFLSFIIGLLEGK